MSLSPGERLILERRLAKMGRTGNGPLRSAAGLLIGGVVLAPVAALLAAVLGLGVVYAMLAGELQQGLAKIQNLDRRHSFQSTRIVDRNGTLLREVFGAGRRTYIPLSQMPKIVRDATIAVEDKTFYTNPGVDPQAMLRAAVNTVRGQSGAGGASTISQQFVRHVAFSDRERLARSYTRKLKELVLAVILNQHYRKDQILEWYLNEIYYGNLAYGIEAAAETIFGKQAMDLDLAESALLVGLPQAPGDLDPLNPDPDVQERVKNRQREVLNLMVRTQVISQAQADAATAEKLTYKTHEDGVFLAPHFVVYVRNVLENMIWVGSERLANGGLTVTTTLDLNLQDMAQSVVADQVAKLKDVHKLSNGALVALEPRTGQVLAMVGSADYWNEAIKGQVNVALRERQPGSSIKPIAYVAAIERGLPTSTMLWDVPMKLPWGGQMYEPQNYDERFHGPVRLRTALANSYNIPALKLLAALGVDNMLDTAHKMGITGLQQGADHYGLSLTLGGGEVTLLDMTTAFATLANGGALIRPNPILRITDSAGGVLYDLKDDEEALKPAPAVDPRAAYIVTNILADNSARTPAFGPSSPLNLGVPAAVKTGTTNDYRDNWTVGYTPYLAVGVWAGNSDNSAMRKSSGVTGAAPIWNAFLRNVVTNRAYQGVVKDARSRFGFDFHTDFKRPKGIIEAPVCQLDSLRQLAATCPAEQTELFLDDHGPGEGGDWQSVASVVVPLPGAPAPGIQESGTDAAPKEGKEDPVPPPALLCLPSGGDFGADKAQPVAVLPLPEDAQERKFVLEWAATHGWAALAPVEPCTPEMVAAAMAPGSLPGGAGVIEIANAGGTPMAVHAEYHLNLETGSVVHGTTQLTGTVVYDPAQVEYFKVELGPGREPREWLTLGDIHHGPVLNGVLETLDGNALAAGDYIVRLVLVKKDGNFLEPPMSVPVRIER